MPIGPGTILQCSDFNKNDDGNDCHNLHYPLTKFHFDTSKDSKEIIRKVTPNIH